MPHTTSADQGLQSRLENARAAFLATTGSADHKEAQDAIEALLDEAYRTGRVEDLGEDTILELFENGAITGGKLSELGLASAILARQEGRETEN